MERTLAIIKPDAVAGRKIGSIAQRIEEAGFQIRAMRMLHLTTREAEGFYAVHRERPFFGSLTAFMSRGPVVVLALEAPDAIKKWRTLMGATDPAKADDGTLRSISASIEHNATPARTRPTPTRSSWATFFGDASSPAESPWQLMVIVGVVEAGVGLMMMAGDVREPSRCLLFRKGNATF